MTKPDQAVVVVGGAIQPSWLNPANILRAGQVEVDQSEDENGKGRKTIIAGVAKRAARGLSKTSGYFARSCSRSGFAT